MRDNIPNSLDVPVILSGMVLAFTLFGDSLLYADVHVFGLVIGIATVSSLVIASRWVSTFLLATLAGHVSDRRGRRPVLAAAFMVEGLSLLAIALIPTALWTIMGAVTMFMAASVAETVLNAVAADTAGEGKVAARMSKFATFDDMGSAAGPLFGYIMASVVGFTVTYVCGAAAVLCLLPTLFSLDISQTNDGL